MRYEQQPWRSSNYEQYLQTSYISGSDYGGETDVSLDCGRFYGPFVRPRMRMSEGANEWMNYFFLIFGNVEPTVEWYWQEKTEGLGDKPVPVPLCQI
jgi:hypothetical protein